MSKQEISTMQQKMMGAVGHRVEIRLTGGYKPCIGQCIDFIQPLDNEPEVAAIGIAVPNRFTTTGRSVYEITEDEIESIAILD